MNESRLSSQGKIYAGSGQGVRLGVGGAFVGGFPFQTFDAAGVTGFNLSSTTVARASAVVVPGMHHAVAGRRRL